MESQVAFLSSQCFLQSRLFRLSVAILLPTYVVSPTVTVAQDGDVSVEGSTEGSVVENNEIVVVADAQDGGIEGVLYRVTESNELPSLSASEVLRQVPFVAVDQEGNVQLLGRAGVTIVVDGQVVRNPRDILEGLRGDQIDSINVITNPSARFPGGSNSGVIELKLREPDGIRRVAVNGQVDTLGSVRASVTPTLELGDLSLTGTLTLADILQESRTIIERTFLGGPSTTELRTLDGSSRSISANSTLKYAASDNFQLSLAVFGGLTDTERNFSGSFSVDPGADGLTSTETRITDFDYLTISPSMSYESEDGEVWKLKFSRSREGLGSQIAREIAAMGSTSSQQISFRGEDALKLDYEGYRNEDRRLRFGAGFQRNTLDDLNAAAGFDFVDFNQTFSGAISQYSAYADLEFNIEKLRVLPGLRVEYREYPTTATEVDFVRFFPSLHLERRFDRGRMLRGSYSRRVSWPSIRDVNSAIQFSDGITAFVGNPQLLPTSQDRFELSFSKVSGRDQIGTTIYAVDERNQFISASELVDGILIIRPENGGSETVVGGSIFIKEGITDEIRADLSFNGALITQRLPNFADIVPEPEFRYTARMQLEYAEDKEEHKQTDTVRIALSYRSARQQGLLVSNDNLALDGSWTHRFSEDIFTTVSVSGINLPRNRVTTYLNETDRFTSTFRDQGLLVRLSVSATID